MPHVDLFALICGKSQWEAYHKLLEELDAQVKSIVNSYVEGRCTDCKPLVIVAPYGSGKTEFAKHLCNWCWSRGIPALIVNLSHIYDYIRSQYPSVKITEDRLVEVLEEFFESKLAEYYSKARHVREVREIIEAYRTRRTKGVLIVDEIEETFNAFKERIIYSTTPWRGVFDAVREERLPFFTILLYGPSSELAEAIHMSGTWRTLIQSIPIFPPDGIERRFLKVEKSVYRKLLANTLFWLGRGRIGLIGNLVSNGIAKITVSKLDELKRDKAYISKIKHMWTELEELLRRDIVENIRIFDEVLYERHLERVDLPERDLLKILTALVGPVSETTLNELFNVERVRGLRLRKVVRSRSYVSKSELVRAIVEVAEKISRGQREVLIYLERIVDAVFDAWSYNDVILLPVEGGRISAEPLKWLVDAASAIAFEMYRFDVAEVLDKIDVENIISTLEKTGNIYELEEDYYAVHPLVLIDVYTPIAVKPLIACSRWAQRDELNSSVVSYAERTRCLLERKTIENLMEYIRDEQLRKVLAEPNVCLYVLPEQDIGKWIAWIEDRVLKDLTSTASKTRRGSARATTHVVLVLPMRKNPDELRNAVQNRLDYLINSGLISIPEVSMRLSAFLQGFIHYLQACPDSRLTPLDSFIVTQYANTLAKVVFNGIAEATTKRTNLSGLIRELKRDIKEYDRLERQRGHVVGEEQAKYFYLVAATPNESGPKVVKDCLSELLNKLEETRKAAESLEDALSRVRREVSREELARNLFKDIRLLAESGAYKYYEQSLKLAEEVSKLESEAGDARTAITTVKRLLGSVFEKMVSRKLCDELVENKTILQLLEEAFSILEMAELMYDPEREPLAYALSSSSLIERLNKVCSDVSYKASTKVGTTTVKLGDWYRQIRSKSDDVTNRLKSLVELLEKLNVGTEYPVIARLKEFNNKLMDFTNMLDTLMKVVSESSERLRGADFAANMLFYEVIFEMIMNKLRENSEQLVSTIGNMGVLVDEIIGLLRRIDYRYEDLKREEETIETITGIDVIDSLREDLKTILKRSANLEELRESLKKYVEEDYVGRIIKLVEEERDVLNERERLRKEFESLRRLLEVSGV